MLTKELLLNYRRVSRMVLLGALMLGLAVLAQAQAQPDQKSSQRGFHPGGSYALSDIETLSQYSGEVGLRIPLGSLPPGRGGLSAGLNLLYSSKLWDSFETKDIDSHANAYDASRLALGEDGGWRYGYQYRLKTLTLRAADEFQGPCDQTGYVKQLLLVTPDGGQHKLWSSYTDSSGFMSILPDGQPFCTGGPPASSTLIYYTTDGTYIRVEVAPDGDQDSTNNSWTLYMPDGTRVQGTGIDAPTGNEKIIDRNGNYIDIINVAGDASYNGHNTTYIKDQMNRAIVIERGYAANQDAVHVKGTGGTEMLWVVQWRDIVVHKTYQFSPITLTKPLDQTITVVDQVTLPTQAGGLSYVFNYNANATSNPSNGWGEVSSVTLPSGAVATYAYSMDGVNGSNVISAQVRRNRPSTKTLTYNEVYDGTTTLRSDQWSYSATFPYADEETVSDATTTGPDGGQTRDFFTPDGYSIATGRPDGSVVERVYAQNVPPGMGLAPYPWDINKYVQYEFTSVKSGNTLTQTAISAFTYDKNGNLTSKLDYDWVSYTSVPRDAAGNPIAPPPGATPLRVMANAYYNPTPDASDTTTSDADIYNQASPPALRRLLYSSEVRNASGTALSRTEAFYDGQAYPQPPVKGNLTLQKSWDSWKGGLQRAYSNPLGDANSVLAQTQYDSYGNPTIQTDARSTQPQLVYNSNQLYVTDTYAGLSTTVVRHQTMVRDFYTGLVTQALVDSLVSPCDNPVTIFFINQPNSSVILAMASGYTL